MIEPAVRRLLLPSVVRRAEELIAKRAELEQAVDNETNITTQNQLHIWLIQSYVAHGQYVRALNRIRSIQANDRNTESQLQLLCSHAFAFMKIYDKALDISLRLAEQLPTDLVAVENVASILSLIGKKYSRQAYQWAQRAIDINPNSVLAVSILSMLSMQTGNLLQSIELAKRCVETRMASTEDTIESFADSTTFYTLQSQLALNILKWRELALQYAELAIEYALPPNPLISIRTYLTLGLLLEKLRRYSAAEDHLQLASALYFHQGAPTLARFYIRRGRLFQALRVTRVYFTLPPTEEYIFRADYLKQKIRERFRKK